MSPSSTSILLGLGLANSLVAIDEWSAQLPGIPAHISRFDMMKPDIEQLASIGCNLLFVSALTQEGTSKDPFKPLSDAGVQVVYIPTSTSIAEIRADVQRIATLTHKETEGEALVAHMDSEIERIKKITSVIPKDKKRTVIFEISAAPTIYSFGSGVYMNELIEAAGAINALGKEKGWIAVSGETILAVDPDVILTNVNSGKDPVAEILSRPGWSGLTASRNKRVYYIDTISSSQPAPDVVKALKQIAEAVYPEYFK